MRQGIIPFLAANGVDGPDGGEKVVHVGFHAPEFRAGLLRAPAASVGLALAVHALRIAFAPDFERTAKVFDRHGVFPFNARGALCVRRRCKAVRDGHMLLRVERGPAVDRQAVVGVDPLKDGLCLAETVWGGVSAGAEEG